MCMFCYVHLEFYCMEMLRQFEIFGGINSSLLDWSSEDVTYFRFSQVHLAFPSAD